MKIFVFINTIANYCSGNFYFVAEDKRHASQIAGDFAFNHNAKINYNRNYTIEWDFNNITEYEIKPGYLPLNR